MKSKVSRGSKIGKRIIIMAVTAAICLSGCGESETIQNDDLLDSFLAGEIGADGNGLFGDKCFYISELQMDEEEWDAYRIGDRLDLDNDGANEQIISGPYGGMFLDASEDSVKVFALGEGTASNLSYSCCDNEYWIVHSDTMHSGRKYYCFDKYFGADNLVESAILEMHYSEENVTESPKYYFNKKEISEAEYNVLYQKYSGRGISE